MQVGIKVQVEKFSKTNKSAGWNNAVQVGKFCCTIIRETKVMERKYSIPTWIPATKLGPNHLRMV